MLQHTNKIVRPQEYGRFEYKYMIPVTIIDSFISLVSKHLSKDPYIGTKGYYPVYSIYFDSPELTSFYEKNEGQQSKRKYRLRLYETGASFFEIKNRISEIVYKQRFCLPEDIKNSSLPYLKRFLHREMWKEESIDYFFCLEPQVSVAFKRAAFIAKEPLQKLRITFDYDLAAQITHTLHWLPKPTLLFGGEFAIMEVKFSHSLPYWFRDFVLTQEIKQVPFSKYEYAVERMFLLS